MPSLYLASASARRSAALRQIGAPFQLLQAEIDETPLPGELPGVYVERLALQKALAGLACCGDAEAVVLGADTSVILDGCILGKPADREDALAMLLALSGREHQVSTAVALVDAQRREVQRVDTRVWFRSLSEAEALAYWESGEPQGKAGSYAIQGLGAVFVTHLEGSYSAVVGLPLYETWALLEAFKLPNGIGAGYE